MKLLALRIAMRVFSWVTPRAAEYIAPPLAAVLWYLSPRKRRVTRLNLRAVYPDMAPKQRQQIGRNSMTHYVRGVFEAGTLWHWPLERVDSYFDPSVGQDALDAAIKDGAGLILAAPHSGAWEILNLYLMRFGMGAVLYKPGKFPEIDEALLEKRRRGGSQMVPANPTGLRTMFKLRKRVRFDPHLHVGPDLDLKDVLTAVNQGIEQCITVDTEQYLWAYKRFRNRPEGDPPFYKKTDRD